MLPMASKTVEGAEEGSVQAQTAGVPIPPQKPQLLMRGRKIHQRLGYSEDELVEPRPHVCEDGMYELTR